jgi:serine/threonine-protein kinase RsbW
MRMKVSFYLTRTPQSVSVARVVVDRIFAALGLHEDCRMEIVLAVSEACANAVQHAQGVAYELSAEADDDQCTITVDDDGPGVDSEPTVLMPPTGATAGRGFALMKSATDGLELRRRPSGGLSVRLYKRLRWQDEALGQRPP